jgi:uncharacterized OsmC-like protein
MSGVALRAKELRYAVGLAADGELTEEHGIPLDPPAAWSPEHLLLAALVRCSLKSLRYHAERRSVAVQTTAGRGSTLVTRRETHERYALVETVVELSVELEPEPDALAELLAAAERDCFVGSSLTAEPRYRWVVNGRAVDT